MHRGTPPAARLFEAAVSPVREQELAHLGLDVVARPGEAPPGEAEPGLIAVSRALGEGRLASILAVERVAPNRAMLEDEGIPCEGYDEGVFIEVQGTGGRRGLQITGPDGLVRRHIVLLRERPDGRSGPTRLPMEADGDTALTMLLAAVYALQRRRARTVRREYLQSLLQPDSGPSPLADPLQRAVHDLEHRLAALRPDQDRTAAVAPALDGLAATLLTAAERAFILDTARSTLELLDPAERDRYLRFAWHDNDFPGAPHGPNEARARQMFSALSRLCPERRANQGDAAFVRRDEFDAAMNRRIRDALIAVPGETGQQLLPDASAAFVETRTAAAADGVTIAIAHSYRTPRQAAAGAARAGNRFAVAEFSSHMLGVAVDLKMSHGDLRFAEVSTRPFRNIVGMYKSPVHKWMFLRGESHGWYPFQFEPWHWEYNPPGFRDRFRRPATTPTAAPVTPTAPPSETDLSEGINDPIAPPRTPLVMRAAVGRGGRNQAADVRAIQDRLVELRVADAVTIAPERPTGATVPDSALEHTIDAIERFQRQMGIRVNGVVAPTGPTRTDLDRAIAVPTAAEFSSIAADLRGIGQTISRGLTITGPVGATATGNAIDDVRAVQQRLVEVGSLPASRRETLTADATGVVPQSRLTATIASLRRFQTHDVRFFAGRHTVTGGVTSGIVRPGDATAALLDRVAVYTMVLGSSRVSFRDHVVSRATRSETGVAFSGTAAPSGLPLRVFTDLGLDAGQAAALRLVSTFEGNFDAINTYDRALVSAGFIQFAGGRGLPPYLALLKARRGAKFGDLLRKYGIDVEFTVSHQDVAGARVIVIDPAGTRVLRGTAAETAIRDDKRLTTALILSGRDRDVQVVQIEAAVRLYVRPALDATIRPSARGGTVRLRDILRSQKGMAALFDRAIQEGLGAAQRRFERVVQRLVRRAEPHPLPTPPPAPPSIEQLQRREGDVLAELERDLQAAADVFAAIERARSSIDPIARAARAAGAATSALLARPELAAARRAVTDARVGLADVVNLSTGANVDAQITAMTSALSAEETRLAFTPPPSSAPDLAQALADSDKALANVAAPLSTAPAFLGRIRRIRRSTLDSGLPEAA